MKPKALYFDQWSRLHGDIDPRKSVVLRYWLSAMYELARPFVVLRVPPDAVTYFGLLVAACVPLCASFLTWPWLLLAGLLCVASGLLDGLDGAVAVLSGRTSRWGFVLDSVVDRISDLLFLLALWLVGAPGLVVAVAGAVMLLLEYARARAASGGMKNAGALTMGERPTRVIVVAVFLGMAAWAPFGHTAGWWAGLGATVCLVVGIVALVQLTSAIRRSFR